MPSLVNGNNINDEDGSSTSNLAEKMILAENCERPETIESALSALKSKYNVIANTLHPTEGQDEMVPLLDAAQMLIWTLSFINFSDHDCTNSKEYRKVVTGLGDVLDTDEDMMEDIIRHDLCDLGVVEHNRMVGRIVQLQIWFRMILLSHGRGHGWALLVHVLEHEGADVNSEDMKAEVQQFAELYSEMAKCYIVPRTAFPHWLEKTMTFGFQHPVPDYFSDLFVHFKIDRSDTADGGSNTDAANGDSPSPKEKSRRNASDSTCHNESEVNTSGPPDGDPPPKKKNWRNVPDSTGCNDSEVNPASSPLVQGSVSQSQDQDSGARDDSSFSLGTEGKLLKEDL